MGYADRVPNMLVMSKHHWVPRVVPILGSTDYHLAVQVLARSSISVAAVTARRIDRLQLLEIELGNRLQLVGKPRSFEAGRQIVVPRAVFLLQRGEGCHRCRPASGSRKGTPTAVGDARCRRRRRSWWGQCRAVSMQLSAMSRLPLGRAHRLGTDTAPAPAKAGVWACSSSIANRDCHVSHRLRPPAAAGRLHR